MPPNNPYQQGAYPPGPQAPYQAAGQPKPHKFRINVWLVATILASLLAVVFIGLFVWAWGERQSYKYDVDQKIAAAVEVAKQETASAKDAEFVEREKEPLKSYRGPSQFGSLAVKYPKTWGAYINEKPSGATNLDGYLHPDFVPGVDPSYSIALRFQVINKAYEAELQQFDAYIKQGSVQVSPYRAAQVPDVLGSRIDGEVVPKKRGSMVLIPLRDKTLKVWTESEDKVKDFNDIILANLSFVP